LTFCNPSRRLGGLAAVLRTMSRVLCVVLPSLLALLVGVEPVMAQSGDVIRDTEIERLMYSYEEPILKAAGIDPASIKMYLLDDPSINAAATYSPSADEGVVIVVNAGTFIRLDSPNQMIGVLAHETGHIAGGHLTRSRQAMSKAMIPMLIGMALGVAVMAAGGGEAGMAVMGLGQQAAQSTFNQFSRAQEGTADRMGQKFLLATHQSGRGMLEVFQKFARDEAHYKIDPMYLDHPLSRDRIDMLQQLVDASPYKDVKDSPEAILKFQLVQAKLAGYLENVDTVLQRYPPSDTSEPARYARAMAYFRKPDMAKALTEINALIKEEPKNPYFWEVLGQIYVEMAQPLKGIAPYQKSVNLLPDAPLLRISLAAAEIATENPALTQPALANLKIALQQESDNTFGWYEAAQAYSDAGNQPMADLSTAERYYSVDGWKQAMIFATRAQQALPEGSRDWERAQDIVAVSAPQAKSESER
jgi:predicted Zn-dependent protease